MKTIRIRRSILLLVIACPFLHGCMTVLETLAPPDPGIAYALPTLYGGYDKRKNTTTYVAETRSRRYDRGLFGSLLFGSSRGEARLVAYTICPGQARNVNQCPASSVRVEFRHYNTSDTQCTYVVGQRMPVTLTMSHRGSISQRAYPALDYKLHQKNNASEVTEVNPPSCELSEMYAWVMDRDGFLTFVEADAVRVSFGGFDYDLTGDHKDLATFQAR